MISPQDYSRLERLIRRLKEHAHEQVRAVEAKTADVVSVKGAIEERVGSIDHGSLLGLGDDDHPQYTTGSEATTIAEAAVTLHEAGSDPHAQYQKEAEKGATSGYAALDATTRVPAAQLATGTPDGTKFLRDDRTWQPVSGLGGGQYRQFLWTTDGSGGWDFVSADNGTGQLVPVTQLFDLE